MKGLKTHIGGGFEQTTYLLACPPAFIESRGMLGESGRA